MPLINLLCFVVFFTSLLFSQIPNAGFEDWATDPDGNNNPVGWQTTNSFPEVNVEPYIPGCQGNFAMKVKTLDLGFISLPGVAIMETGYSFNQAPTKFSACVKSNIMPGDQALIIVALMKGDSIIASTADCTFRIDSTISQFTYLEFPIAIRSNLVPDSLYIMVASGLTNVQIGTEIIVDEISFSGGSSTNVLEEKNLPGAFLLAQNYPNPFNPSTIISYQLPTMQRVSLKVFDVLGNEITTLVNEEKPAGIYEVTFNAGNLPSGLYFYKLQTGTFNESKKMVLIK